MFHRKSPTSLIHHLPGKWREESENGEIEAHKIEEKNHILDSFVQNYRKTNFSTSGRHILHLVPRSELGMVSSRQTWNFTAETKGYSPIVSSGQPSDCFGPEIVKKKNPSSG
jgi:hypothetical protein